MAVRSEHPHDKAPSALYSDDLGTTLGELAAVSASLDSTSLPHILFADLMMTVQFFESSSGRVPGSFFRLTLCLLLLLPLPSVAPHLRIQSARIASASPTL